MLNILISLHRGYGLGDAVQMSAVLRHVHKYRKNWHTDLQAEAGRHCIGRGLVENHFEFGHNPNPNKVYDGEVEILLYDTWANWQDRPNTRVSSVLHEKFGMGWDAECGRYHIEMREESVDPARAVLRLDKYRKPVAIHYQGDSSQIRKNLSDQQVDDICTMVEDLGYAPVILDWRSLCPLPYHRIRTPAEWGKDAEMVCAVISQCAAFVGIDSGPSKCASATDTPSLVVWTGHHPAPFHDPAPNTTHLVPCGYHGLEPVCGDPGVIEWFESHYDLLHYIGDPVKEVKAWLKHTLS